MILDEHLFKKKKYLRNLALYDTSEWVSVCMCVCVCVYLKSSKHLTFSLQTLCLQKYMEGEIY